MTDKSKNKCNECDGAICPHYAQCLQNDIKEKLKKEIQWK